MKGPAEVVGPSTPTSPMQRLTFDSVLTTGHRAFMTPQPSRPAAPEGGEYNLTPRLCRKTLASELSLDTERLAELQRKGPPRTSPNAAALPQRFVRPVLQPDAVAGPNLFADFPDHSAVSPVTPMMQAATPPPQRQPTTPVKSARRGRTTSISATPGAASQFETPYSRGVQGTARPFLSPPPGGVDGCALHETPATAPHPNRNPFSPYIGHRLGIDTNSEHLSSHAGVVVVEQTVPSAAPSCRTTPNAKPLPDLSRDHSKLSAHLNVLEKLDEREPPWPLTSPRPQPSAGQSPMVATTTNSFHSPPLHINLANCPEEDSPPSAGTDSQARRDGLDVNGSFDGDSRFVIESSLRFGSAEQHHGSILPPTSSATEQRFGFFHVIPWKDRQHLAPVPLHHDVNGTVWLGTGMVDGIPYSVKQVLESSMINPCEVDALHLSSRCNSIVRLYNVFHHVGPWTLSPSHSRQAKRRPVFVVQTEYFSRGCLWEFFLGRNVLPTEREIRKVLGDVFAGLAELHAAGIAHRNCTVLSAFVDNDGSSKIGNFGACRRFDGASGTDPLSPLRAELFVQLDQRWRERNPQAQVLNSSDEDEMPGFESTARPGDANEPSPLPAMYCPTNQSSKETPSSRDVFSFSVSLVHLLWKCVLNRCYPPSERAALVDAFSLDRLRFIGPQRQQLYSQSLIELLRVLTTDDPEKRPTARAAADSLAGTASLVAQEVGLAFQREINNTKAKIRQLREALSAASNQPQLIPVNAAAHLPTPRPGPGRTLIGALSPPPPMVLSRRNSFFGGSEVVAVAGNGRGMGLPHAASVNTSLDSIPPPGNAGEELREAFIAETISATRHNAPIALSLPTHLLSHADQLWCAPLQPSPRAVLEVPGTDPTFQLMANVEALRLFEHSAAWSSRRIAHASATPIVV